MKHLFNTSILLACLFTQNFSNAQPLFNNDQEPNDLYTQAIPISLGVPFEGRLTNTGQGVGDFDIYSFTQPDDGVILISIESEQSGNSNALISIDCHPLSDTSLLNYMTGVRNFQPGANHLPVSATGHIDCLRAGTHYFRVHTPNMSSQPFQVSYKITMQLRPMAFANDAEPNDSIADAIPLAPNTPTEGRVACGFPYGNYFWGDVYEIHKSYVGPLVLFSEGCYEELSPSTPVWWSYSVSQYNGGPIMDEFANMGSFGVPVLDTCVFLNVLDTGVYYVTVPSSTVNGLSYRFSYADSPLGIEEIASTAISVFHDPSLGGVVFSGSKMKTIDVFDNSGRLVHSDAPNSTRAVWNTTNALQGFYIARFMNDSGEGLSLRFVVP